MYLEHESLIATIAALDERGWTTKKWTTKKGKERGGRPFNKNTLYSLLMNVTYLGMVRFKDEVHDGQHDAIVDAETFERVQKLLRSNHRTAERGFATSTGRCSKAFSAVRLAGAP